MPALRRIFFRLLAGLGVIWGAGTAAFVAVHVTEGDPAVAILSGGDAWASAEVLDAVRREYGLDQPLPVQYARYLGRLFRGDLGESYRLRTPVTKAIGQQLGPTVALTATASVTALLLAVSAAVLTARRHRSIRNLAAGIELTLSSTPAFVLGVLLLLVFAFQIPLFPASGQTGPLSLVLPSLTLALPLSAMIAQVLRQELELILEQPFIVAARSRGLRETTLRTLHALRHALIPLTTMTGFVVGGLLGGAVIVESLFARQGVGRLMLDAALNKDVPVVLGITLLAAATYVVVNLAVDILYLWIDPRVRSL